jgi:hypothetical protein
LGIVLVSAVSPINDEDLNMIRSLAQAGIPAKVLLSKADLLEPQDLWKALSYIRKVIADDLGLQVTVHPVSTVAAGERLLQDWFHNDLEPLFQRHRELSRQSVQRKVGALREEVLTALRSKLGTVGGQTDRDRARLREVEDALRKAAGSQEGARSFCSSETDSIRMMGRAALDASAAAVMAHLGELRPRASAFDTVITSAIHEVAAGAASRISTRLRAVGEELDLALKLAAVELGADTTEDSVGNCLREMPRFEVSLPEMEVTVPWYCLSKRWAEWWLVRNCRRSLQPEVDAAFIRYSRALEAWIRGALSDLQTRFSAQADGFRAQLARLTTTQAVSPEERSRIEADLARLDDFEIIGGDVDPQGLRTQLAVRAGGEGPREVAAPRPTSS